MKEVLSEFRSFGDRPARGLRGVAPALRGRRSRARSCSRAGAAARKNQLLFELEGTKGGRDVGARGSPDELVLRPADGPRPDRRQGSRCTNAPSARPLSRYPAGHGEGYGGRLPEPLRAESIAPSRARRASRSRPSPTATAASRALEAGRRERAGGGGWVEVRPPGRLTPRLQARARYAPRPFRSAAGNRNANAIRHQRRREEQGSRARSPRG